MQRALVIPLFGLVLSACGGGDDNDGSEGKPSCAIGVTLTGAVRATFSIDDELQCAVFGTTDPGIDTAFYPRRDITNIQLRIADVTEGEVGADFSTGVAITALDLTEVYGTSSTGCRVTLSEHSLKGTEMSEFGEERHYQVVGTGSCSEPAVAPSTETPGEVALSDFSFRIHMVWRD